MAIRNVIQLVIRPAIRRVFENIIRSAYRFDGVDDYAVLPYRAINPDGDNTLEFFSVETENTTILAQNISATIGSREFQLWQGDLMELNLTFGGSTTNLCTVAQGYISRRRYFLTLTGTSFTLARDTAGNVIRSATFTKGAAREPAAQTLIMCRSAGVGTFASFSRGLQYNVRINGVLWAMDQRNQTIQLPSPSGLGAELITPTVLENPAVKGTQWTYLGAGRWQYVGDGTFNALQFILPASQPSAGYVEFEVESVSGTCTAAANNISANFNTTGVKRYFYTSAGASNSNLIEFKRASGVASCVIKNISFKPLGTCNPLTLVNTTSDRWQEVTQ